MKGKRKERKESISSLTIKHPQGEGTKRAGLGNFRRQLFQERTMQGTISGGSSSQAQTVCSFSQTPETLDCISNKTNTSHRIF